MIHLDTSVLIDAFTGPRRSLPGVRRATVASEAMTMSSLVFYEWLRGARTDEERQTVEAFFASDAIVVFGVREAELAATLHRQVKRARQRQADLAIAACAIEHGARLWTLNPRDFSDIPDLRLYP